MRASANNAFGSVAPTGSRTVNLRFAGQYADAESGLFYNHNRYYDPKTGRYISSDLIGLGGGLNTFAYTGANPVMYVDPEGKLFFVPYVIVIGIGIGILSVADGYMGGIAIAGMIDNIQEGNLGAAAWDGGTAVVCAVAGAGIVKLGGKLLPKSLPKALDDSMGEAEKILKMPRPSIPNGVTSAEFGQEIIGWGAKANGAESLSRTLNKSLVDAMRKKGLNKDMVEEWIKFYENEFARNPGNAAAGARAELMRKILKYF